MSSIRIIPRIDIKGEKLVKTIRLEGVKSLGDPIEFKKNIIQTELMRFY